MVIGGGQEFPIPDGERQRPLLLCVLPWPESAALKVVDEIRDEFPNLELLYIHEQYQDRAERGKIQVPEDTYKRASIIATLSWLPPNASAIPDVKLIQFFSAGINHVAQHPIYKDSDIPLATASGVHGPQIAEWVIMMHLVHSHNYTQFYEAQKKSLWDKNHGGQTRDAVGQTVGILGYGSIGRQVARVAQAMGMHVLAYTASPRKTPESKHDDGFIVPGTGDAEGLIPKEWFSGLDKESLRAFLAQGVDLLVVCVPLTKQTTHFLSTPEFEVLQKANPHGTYISNISRGAIIDQPALITALETNQIAGASLDVTDPEPLPADHPLWKAPNCLITPHVSGNTTVYAARGFQLLRENLRRLRDGGKVINQIDRERGY
ncbi:hypothetical protein P154DRAFT_523327 [Amniculicola lignicola CBS 123094]|uniref:D-isomer specific 2-hydroxyacid dehydrogenase NAD-binding domain-containing protein n=1 Tax=Amniculicola lignicola CBS 123094 TaxID=1392246 RepID=A0A6A5WHF1_9PLEO|nr:hypothetical protein P154DRAFT_523327 [Amniculicola lignicola CBS 123094]